MSASPRPVAGSIGRLLICALLVLLAGASWLAGRAERTLAETDEALMTLQYDVPEDTTPAVEASIARLPALPLVETLRQSARDRRAVGAYWAERDAPSDAANAFVSANRAFRHAQQARDRQAAMQQLDTVLAQYAEVLKANPQHLDAAYNYEYVARLRTRLAKARDTRALTSGGGASIHGREGAPPDAPEVKQFKMFVPMQPDERKNVQPDAGKGEKKPRKG